MLTWSLGAVWLAVAGVADGGVAVDYSGGTAVLSVRVGQTRSLEVGYARGLACDDTSLIHATLLGGKTSNKLLVTGIKDGTTLCRVGTVTGGPHLVVTVTVSPGARGSPDQGPPAEGAPEHGGASGSGP